jgi:hypothetical protein
MATQAHTAMLTAEAVRAHPTDAKSDSKDIENTKEEVDHSVTDSEDLDLERWNEPRANAYRYFATIFAFTIMGMNDAAYGVSESRSFICSCFPTFMYGYVPSGVPDSHFS